MATSSRAPHPLEELTPDEITQAVQATKAYIEKTGVVDVQLVRWNVCALQEPPKKLLLAYEKAPGPHTLPPRMAFIIVHTPLGEPGVFEVLVRLEGRGPLPKGPQQVTSWKKIDGVHALATPDDCLEAEALVKADPEVRARLAHHYGITDMDLLACDPWSVHTNPVGGTARCIQTFLYMRSSPADNQYAHPLDMVPLVDLNTKRVVRIDMPLTRDAPPGSGGQLVDRSGRVSWNREDNNYHRELAPRELPGGGWDRPMKPINVVQPQGPSFEVEGNLVRWGNWSFRLGFNYREGIVLHLVKFRDGTRLRNVAHRLSLVEMAVPYADPREPYVRKCAFDVGDYGLGFVASSLSLGCDCLGAIRYFDGVFVNAQGQPTVLHKAVCMHEEDAGLLWKHVDYRTGHSESRRSRRLVISSIATVVNYEYCMYWYLYPDGTISLDIKLTGELSTNMLSSGVEAESGMPLYGTLVGPQLNAQHHQHMFCARLDMSVDDEDGGAGCIVTEVDVERLPLDGSNPYMNGFRAVQTVLETTSQAQREIAPEKGRLWKVQNPANINPVTRAPVAYKLVPMAHPPLLADEQSIIGQKAVFASKQLWVTPHDDTQRFPAGEYVFNASRCTGLSVWTKQDKPLVGCGADPVLWYSFGVTHIVRAEDFPIMPVEVCSFSLKPYGFFTKNPTLGIPPEHNPASVEVSATAPVAGPPATSGGAGAPCCNSKL